MLDLNSDVSGEIPVVVLGAGPVGLALANDLTWRGVRCLLIDRRTEPLYFPTSESIQARTMEHFRRWGIAEKVRFAGFPPDTPRSVQFVTRLKGYELGRVDRPSNRQQREVSSPISPEGPVWCPKYLFEEVMRNQLVNGKTTEFLFGHEVTGIVEDASGINVSVQDLSTLREFTVRCRYLAACDGASGNTRKIVDLPYRGTFAEGHNLGIFLRSADLRRIMDKRGGVMVDIINPDFNANLSAVDGRDLWRLIVFMRAGDPSKLDPKTCIRQAAGQEIEAEILEARTWAGHTVVAERFQKGSVFLVGDAAHLLWPRGGFGMNTGIGDAADLGWKLDAVLSGWGGPSLLESYDAERRPIAIRNVSEAARNYQSEASLSAPANIEDQTLTGEAQRSALAHAIVETRSREWNTMGLQLGYRYDESPICWYDGHPEPVPDGSRYVPSTQPGARAPHVWLSPGVSTLDHFGRGFCLVHYPNAEIKPFVMAASERRIPFTTLKLTEADPMSLYEKALVLVRPDGHVCWRGDGLPADPGAIFDQVTGSVTPYTNTRSGLQDKLATPAGERDVV